MARADAKACLGRGHEQDQPAVHREQNGAEPADRDARHAPVRRAVRVPGNGTKRARIGKASGSTDRSFGPDAVRSPHRRAGARTAELRRGRCPRTPGLPPGAGRSGGEAGLPPAGHHQRQPHRLLKHKNPLEPTRIIRAGQYGYGRNGRCLLAAAAGRSARPRAALVRSGHHHILARSAINSDAGEHCPAAAGGSQTVAFSIPSAPG